MRLDLRTPVGNVGPEDGDNVTIEFTAYRANSDTNIEIGYPNIFNTQ